jgi:hypothetical protein
MRTSKVDHAPTPGDTSKQRNHRSLAHEPNTQRTESLLKLQRQYGNRFVQRVISRQAAPSQAVSETHGKAESVSIREKSSKTKETIFRVPDKGRIPDRFQFSTHCGWIDWSHADPGITGDVLNKVKATGAGSTLTVVMSNPAHTGKVTAKILSSLTAGQQESVALGIFRVLTRVLETAQSDLDFFLQSSFSVEDLPSNLVGFYRDVKGYDKATARTLCDAWDKDRSVTRFDADEKKGLFEMKNTEWQPMAFGPGGSWPKEFSTITPEPPGKLWTVVAEESSSVLDIVPGLSDVVAIAASLGSTIQDMGAVVGGLSDIAQGLGDIGAGIGSAIKDAASVAEGVESIADGIGSTVKDIGAAAEATGSVFETIFSLGGGELNL